MKTLVSAVPRVVVAEKDVTTLVLYLLYSVLLLLRCIAVAGMCLP